MFERFYSDVDSDLCHKFIYTVRKLNQPLSPAQIQGHFLLYKFDPQIAIERIADIIRPLK